MPPAPHAVEGAEAAISAWIAGECDRVLLHELRAEEEKLHGLLVSAAKGGAATWWEEI